MVRENGQNPTYRTSLHGMFKRHTLPVGVVIPCYRADFAAYEQVAFDRCLATLHRHPITIVKPAGLDLGELFARFPHLREENFPDSYFLNVASYNDLMLTDEFYARFANYKYVLIHQLDAFVFSDQLLSWCRRGFDYIGAPWLPDGPVPPRRSSLQVYRDRFRIRREIPDINLARNIPLQEYMYAVGNGGFSLRRVKAMRKILKVFGAHIARHRAAGEKLINEDMLFGLEARKALPRLRLPDFYTAAGFAWELQPKIAATVNRGRLPFGCHGWNKLHREDWRPIFSGLGYDLDAILRE